MLNATEEKKKKKRKGAWRDRGIDSFLKKITHLWKGHTYRQKKDDPISTCLTLSSCRAI